MLIYVYKRLQVILSDTQGFGLLGTASADGQFPAESGSRGSRPDSDLGRTRGRGTHLITLKGAVHCSSFGVVT